jgi:hypothetical protein
MKNNKLITTAILLLGVTSSFAAGTSSFPIANGTINSVNKVANLSLAAIQNQPNNYDVTCLITGTNTDKIPASLYPYLILPVENNSDVPYFMYYDGRNISPSGHVLENVVINDTKTHRLNITISGTILSSATIFTFNWRGGDASSTINYACSAEQSAVKVQK